MFITKTKHKKEILRIVKAVNKNADIAENRLKQLEQQIQMMDSQLADAQLRVQILLDGDIEYSRDNLY